MLLLVIGVGVGRGVYVRVGRGVEPDTGVSAGIGVGTLFGEQIAIKASNENTKEIETIEARTKPTWLPPQPFLDLGVKARLMYERLRARSEI